MVANTGPVRARKSSVPRDTGRKSKWAHLAKRELLHSNRTLANTERQQHGWSPCWESPWLGLFGQFWCFGRLGEATERNGLRPWSCAQPESLARNPKKLWLTGPSPWASRWGGPASVFPRHTAASKVPSGKPNADWMPGTNVMSPFFQVIILPLFVSFCSFFFYNLKWRYCNGSLSAAAIVFMHTNAHVHYALWQIQLSRICAVLFIFRSTKMSKTKYFNLFKKGCLN